MARMAISGPDARETRIPLRFIQVTRCELTRVDLYGAVMVGTVERVRPKMMTVVAIMAGLLPIMWSTGAGSKVVRRIAAPMIGGMVTSTIPTLIVIPPVYAYIQERRLRAPNSQEVG